MQKIQLSIPEPCHENWNKMTPTEQGRFCNSCAKEVIDFAMMTDSEVLNYFSSLTNAKVCGRVLPSQLDREISRPQEPRKRLFWYWNYVAMFFLFFSKSNLLKAQKGKIKPDVITTPTYTKTMGIMVMPAPEGKLSHHVSGKVVDADGNPVSFATVKIKGSRKGINTDQNGSFGLNVFNSDVLQVSASSFNPVEIKVGLREEIIIILEKSSAREVTVVTLAGGISFRDPEEKLITPIKPKRSDEFVIRDMNGNTPLANVSLFLIKTGTLDQVESGLTDSKGMYWLKRVSKEDGYDIKVSAVGYESTEFTISGKEFNDRKKAWEILLVKKYVPETHLRLGQVSIVNQVAEPIYVVDGIIDEAGKTMDPDEIRSLEILKPAEATALFGAQGIHGAIMITTKESRLGKTKDLDTVVVNVIPEYKGQIRISGMVQVDEEKNEINALMSVDNKNSPVLTVFPNPVNRGQHMYIDLSSFQAGQYELCIYQSSGALMDKRPLRIAMGMKRMTLQAGSHWIPGQYYLVITDPQGIKSSPHIFIVL